MTESFEGHTMTETFEFQNSNSYGSQNCKGIGLGGLDNYYCLNQFIGLGDGIAHGFGETNLTGEGDGLATSPGNKDLTGMGFGNQFPTNAERTKSSVYSFSLCGTYDSY
jgi:hypothetical protein